MKIDELFMVFPDGDSQQISRPLQINQLIDLNGNTLVPPLPTHKMLVYSVFKKKMIEKTGYSATYFYLEQLSSNELLNFV